MRAIGKKNLLSLGAALALAGMAFLLWRAPAAPERAPAEGARSAADQAILDAAMARIAADSQSGPRQPRIEAAPRPADAPDSAPTGAAPAPIPPEGYSFVAVQGEMPKARFRPEGAAALERPAASLDWLNTADALEALSRQARAAGRAWSFGWLELAPGFKLGELELALQPLGAELLGASGSLARARLPGDAASLRAIAALAEVRGLGAVPSERKLPAALAEEAANRLPHEQLPAFVTLMADGDPDGRWRQALQDLGAVVGRFDADLRAYSANVPYGALNALADADFVLRIEPLQVARAVHDTAVPAMGADALRIHAAPGLFDGTGGASVPIGVMDTGLNIQHLDISTNRESICGANLVFYEPTVEDADLWVDEGLHGTHVTGTMVGNGYVDPQFAGMAPSVAHIRFAKVLERGGSGDSGSIVRGMDFLAKPSGCPEAGWSADRVKPLIVNMSLSGLSRRFEGRGYSVRKLDSIVWRHRQLYVVAQANSSINGFSNFGTAKNSLSVGAALDSGEIASFSSHGPTADGRLAPQIAATGVRLTSARGGGGQDKYITYSGTSMSSPAVAGVAALLMDAVPAHREQPALTRARLMASAIRPEVWLESPAQFPMDNSNGPGVLQAQYGLGKVSARTSVLSRDQADGWVSGSAIAEPADGEQAYQDIQVPENASRLDLVMTWDEPPVDTLDSTVLNDLDLWLDRDGDCGLGACGEHSSQSRKDNVEWLILRNPAPGTYRAKVVATRSYVDAPRAALAWTVIRGPSTPSLSIEADREALTGAGRLTLTVTANGYVAAGARLDIGCRDDAGAPDCAGLALSEASSSREDGISRSFSADLDSQSSIALGEIAVGERQEIAFDLRPGESPARLYFKASAWNARAASTSVEVRAEAADPRVAEIERPAHDDFAAAATIEGEQGERALDLLRATSEPGEPLFSSTFGRPAGSVWHLWTAPAHGAFRFRVQGPRLADDVQLDVFRGDRMADLERLASNPNAVTLFAEQDAVYRVRASHARKAVPLTLRWSRDSRPANDDLAAAVALEGADGTFEGSNEGATLELGEQFGRLAATTWHRWTAPSDGDWAFRTSEAGLSALAFVGDSISSLRLVSGYPTGVATFPAKSGQEYLIAVAAEDAYADGRSYRLDWEATERDPGNDDFQGAQDLDSRTSSSRDIRISERATVQPGEPVETGVRTAWWAWKAPSSGHFTWRLQTSYLDSPYTCQGRCLRMAAFTGDSLDELQFVGTTSTDVAANEFTFAAVAEQRYWFSVGFPPDDPESFILWQSVEATLRWGPTPENDSLANAAPLTGGEGSVSGSNQYGTIERGERTGALGDSSLWWSYEAPASGFYRFWVEDGYGYETLAIYRHADGGFGALERLTTSALEDVLFNPTEAIFHAEAGTRYLIRVGTGAGRPKAQFRLRWAQVEAASHLVPLLPASTDAQQHGFVRVINNSDQSGMVRIDGFDDRGVRRGSVDLSIEANQAIQFNSEDFEQGNPDKGLDEGVGAADGDWRLRLTSNLELEILAYTRSANGFLASLHDLAPRTASGHRAPIFEPAGNRDQASLLRLINPNEDAAAIRIAGIDDQGVRRRSEVHLTLPPNGARTLTAAQLESGDDLIGALGESAGRWRLLVAADRIIDVMSLLEDSEGRLANLSGAPAAPESESDGDRMLHRVPLFPSAAADPMQQGLLRIVNLGMSAGQVEIRARDDSIREYDPVELSLDAGKAVHLSSDDLEQGNAEKGLSGGIGAGEGHWRLELRTDLDIEALAYVRSADGFLTSMHDLAPQAADEHRIPIFNPGSNQGQRSLLRLINLGEQAAAIAIRGTDDQGQTPDGTVQLSLPPHSARMLTAQQLESGEGEGLTGGGLGDGAGKWRLTVKADRAIQAMNLLQTPDGLLVNLSTIPNRAAAAAATKAAR